MCTESENFETESKVLKEDFPMAAIPGARIFVEFQGEHCAPNSRNFQKLLDGTAQSPKPVPTGFMVLKYRPSPLNPISVDLDIVNGGSNIDRDAIQTIEKYIGGIAPVIVGKFDDFEISDR